MTVIDIRNIFSDRHIELVDVNPSTIYYAEEKNEEGHNNLFLLEYNRKTRKERLVTNYSLEDPTFIEHIFAFEKTLLLILENGSNSLWMIEIDKKSGGELNRRKIVCTGAFKECMALDSEHLLICMAPDEENAEVFEKYKEITGCDCLCYLYNVKTNQKYFVKAPLIARLGCDNIKLINLKGTRYLLLLDPFADESIKESYYREQRWINADIRDNIWLCKAEDIEKDIESGSEAITKKCIASADIKALVRYMGTEGGKVFFRAKEFRSGVEKICSYDIAAEALAVEATLELPKDGTIYLIEEKPFKTFSVKNGKTKTHIHGIINSEADFDFDNSLGSFMTCIESRYAITSKAVFSEQEQKEHLYYYIYDAQLDKYENYECGCRVKGDTLVLY